MRSRHRSPPRARAKMASMPAVSRPEGRRRPGAGPAAAFADVGPSTRFFAVVLPVVRVAPRGEPAVAAVAPVAPAVVYVPAYVLVDPAGGWGSTR